MWSSFPPHLHVSWHFADLVNPIGNEIAIVVGCFSGWVQCTGKLLLSIIGGLQCFGIF